MCFKWRKTTRIWYLLYGKEIEPNVIYFDVPSDYDDYEPKYRQFNVNVDSNGKELMMHKELIQRIEEGIYDCIAHIRTHSFIGETSRMNVFKLRFKSNQITSAKLSTCK